MKKITKRVALATLLTFTLASCTTDSAKGSATVEPPDIATTVTSETEDTMAPVIKIVEDTVAATAGTELAKLDLSDNVESVDDDNDGSLIKIDELKDGTSGYMLDYSSVKTDDDKKIVKGTYTITVEAQDSSGNVSTETFELKVSAGDGATASKSTTTEEKTSKTGKKDTSNSTKTATPSNTNKTSSSSSKKNNSTSGTTSKSNGSNSSSGNTTSKKNNSSSSSSSSSKNNASTPKATAAPTATAKPQATLKPQATSTPQATATPAVHEHSWTYHAAVEATGHNEQVLVKAAWDETKTVQTGTSASYTVCICSYCGQEFATSNDWANHLSSLGFDEDNPHSYASYTVRQRGGEPIYETQTIHHDAEYTTKWVQDTPAQAAYYSCSCGATKAA